MLERSFFPIFDYMKMAKIAACRRRFLFATFAAVINPTAIAHAVGVPAELPVSQRKLIEVMPLTPAFEEFGIDRLRAIQAAKENLSRAELMAGCPRAQSARADGMLDPAYRHQVERTVLNTQRIMLSEGASTFRYWMGGPLWAFEQLSDGQIRTFLSLSQTPQGLRARSLFAQQTYLEIFGVSFIDPGSGQHEPAAVILLKQYFKAEGALPQLERALQAVAPHLVSEFLKVRDFDAHAMSDGPWLRALTSAIGQVSEALAKQLFA